jgi:uroporphyrinogen-III synthase
MTGAVVITRPRRKPRRWRPAALGRVVEVPLLEIAAAGPVGLAGRTGRLHQYALVAFVSPNAIDAAFAHIRTGRLA